MAESRTIDMLHGPIAGKLLLFGLPVAVMGVLQQLFNAADVAALGQFVGKHAMAAVGSNTPIIGSLISLLLGMSLGANVVIAHHLGSGKTERVRGAVQTSIVTALAGGLVIMLAGEALVMPLLRLLGTPESIIADAASYLRCFLLGVPGISVYNFAAAILRSRGDTRSPLRALIAASAVNIALNLLFVLGFGLEAAGVGAATAVANTVAAVILLRTLCRSRDILRVDLKGLFVDMQELRGIIRIGLPAGLQGMVFSVSNLLVQAALNSLGPDAIAASAAAFTIEINIYSVINAIGQGVTTFVSQSYGARNIERCFRVARIGLALEVALVTPIGIFVILLAKPILGFFNPDPAIIALGFIRVLYLTLPQYLSVGMEILSGVLRGFGNSLAPALATMFCICGVRVAWVLTVFEKAPSFEVLMMVYPVSWAAALAVIAAIYVCFRKKATAGGGAAQSAI